MLSFGMQGWLLEPSSQGFKTHHPDNSNGWWKVQMTGHRVPWRRRDKTGEMSGTCDNRSPPRDKPFPGY